MENRFSFKDLVIVSLIVIAIVLIILGMFQNDRHWSQLETINGELKNQTRDLSAIRRLLAEGVAVGGATRPSDVPAGFVESHQNRLAKVTEMPGYSTGDWLVQATSSPPERLTPVIDSDLFSSTVGSLIFDTLAVRNPETLEFIPSVARWWEIADDGLQMTFHMRRDIVFSDGEPMNADDVIYTFQLMMNPEIEAERIRVYLQKVSNVEKVDDFTVRFHFSEFYYQNFEVVATSQILPEHFYSKFSPKEFNESVGLVLGSGPYRLSDPTSWRYEPGRPFELLRNERHWGVPAPFDKVVWQIQPDPGARLISFKNGETDRFGATPEQYRDLVKDEELLKRAQNFELQAPDDGYIYVGWHQAVNGQKTPFADKRVRQALTMLIDRQGIVDNILYGYGQVATGPFHPLSKQHDPSIQPWPYDVARAKALLAEAGFSDTNGDGIIDGPDGKPFSFKLSYPSSSNTLERIALFVKDTLRQGGVLCEPEAVEWSVLLQRIRQKGVESSILGWGGAVEGDPYQIFHSSGIEGTGDNRISYSNPELDRVMEVARTTVDEDERNKLWHEVHRILHEDQPYTFLFNSKGLLLVDRRFQNVKPTALGLNSFREWFVPEDRQKWGR